ncbi:tol-pal system protein YbgF [Marinomonas sp. A79]|uniref:Cell division coordinator CpoB n=1 Tax=Marinomonas vulgaris TaxID=2823372 RepID=A0ABS5HAI8_9GAMM|nr:tol-pal system protein YbgF [Marinomonas vulgaris]MBR7888467.1 tol-pal system protein YbgF [Marinomonas vulgaris]
MLVKNIKVRSFAMALYFTAPFALAESSAGLTPSAAADLLFQLETLQQEVQSLRGQLEEQGHELKLMKSSQRDRYIDLDKRISLLMTAPPASSPQPTAIVGSPVPSEPVIQETAAVVSSALPTSPLTPVTLQPPSEMSQKAYNDAYGLIRQRSFDDAEVSLAEFVKTYPNNSLTGNGYYWLGEVKLVQGKAREALTAFTTVIQRFPGHNKEPDSLYKLGTVSDQLGDTVKAKGYLQDVIRRFPDTKAAKLSSAYLSKVK